MKMYPKYGRISTQMETASAITQRLASLSSINSSVLKTMITSESMSSGRMIGILASSKSIRMMTVTSPRPSYMSILEMMKKIIWVKS